MRVLFLNPWDRLIGPNRYLVEMLRHAPEMAQKSTVVFPQADEALEEYRELGCQVLIWPEIGLVHPHPTVRSVVQLLLTHSAGLFRVTRRMRSLDPDVVISNSEILWVGGMAARLMHIPHMQVFHGLISEYRFRGKPILWKNYLSFLSLWSQRFIAVSEALASALRSGGISAKKIVLIHNPIPLNYFRPQISKDIVSEYDSLLQNRYPILLCVGQIFPVKGQDLLLKALPMIKERYPQVLCIFAGRVGSPEGLDDTERFHHQLLRRVEELNLGSNVRFLGEVNHLDILYKRAHVCVNPSRMESFCRVIAEALLCGTPVVAFAVGAIPEVAGPGALLVPSGDIKGLAKAIIDTLMNPNEARARAEKGRTHVEQQFNAVDVARRFYDAIVQMVPRKRCS
jgi:glycosyltransferase involved in cell wall biosynthesis